MSELEQRIEALEDRLSALDGAEPTTNPPGAAPFTLAQARSEIWHIWDSIAAIRDDMALIRKRLGM